MGDVSRETSPTVLDIRMSDSSQKDVSHKAKRPSRRWYGP